MRVGRSKEVVLVHVNPLIEVACNLVAEIHVNMGFTDDLRSLLDLLQLDELLEQMLGSFIKNEAVLHELLAHHVEDFLFLEPRGDVGVAFDFKLLFLLGALRVLLSRRQCSEVLRHSWSCKPVPIPVLRVEEGLVLVGVHEVVLDEVGRVQFGVRLGALGVERRELTHVFQIGVIV